MIYDDAALQGDDPERPKLLALLAELDSYDVVIMRQQDRISRDPVIWGTCAAAFQKARVRVETFTGTIDLDTPQGRFVADMMAAVGKLEKGQTAQRVRQAVQARARAGQHLGVAPYGYRFEDKLLVTVANEAVIVERIYADYVRGMLAAGDRPRAQRRPRPGAGRRALAAERGLAHPRQRRVRGEGRAWRPGPRRRSRRDRQRGAVGAGAGGSSQ